MDTETPVPAEETPDEGDIEEAPDYATPEDDDADVPEPKNDVVPDQ